MIKSTITRCCDLKVKDCFRYFGFEYLVIRITDNEIICRPNNHDTGTRMSFGRNRQAKVEVIEVVKPETVGELVLSELIERENEVV